jgi:type II restriction enzyme
MVMKSVKSAVDLQTTKQATVDGFTWQAVEKSNRASEYTKVAKHFRSKAPAINSHTDFRTDPLLYKFAVAACALSQKSLNHLSDQAITDIFKKLIDLARLQNEDYLIELEGRYFLTCGDSLGGSMRNVIGQAAQVKLTDLLLQQANAHHKRTELLKNTSKKIVGIIWGQRTIIFDKKPKFINKSVDLILLKGAHRDISRAIEDPSLYLLAGELKGGIDPAGADEHWKTARSALDRISEAFQNKKLAPPTLVFIGAAIEAAMAVEIYSRIADGVFYAANLTKKDQLDEVVDYIVKL